MALVQTPFVGAPYLFHARCVIARSVSWGTAVPTTPAVALAAAGDSAVMPAHIGGLDLGLPGNGLLGRLAAAT